MAEEENQELDEESLKERETVIMDIGKKFRDDGKAVELENMIKRIRPFTKLLSKAKAAKLIRGLVDMYLDMETGASKGRAEQAVELCKECIQWATEEKRIFLRQVRFLPCQLFMKLFPICVGLVYILLIAGSGGQTHWPLFRCREIPGRSG